MPIRVLDHATVAALIDPLAIIDSQRAVFAAYARGEVALAPRGLLPGPDGSTAFAYAARAGERAGAVAKFGSVNPANVAAGRPAISATILAQDPTTGRLAAILDGEAVTTARTAAASAVAAQLLAAPGPGRVAVLGAGVQARAHLRALAAVGLLGEAVVIGRSAGSADALVTELGPELGVPLAAGTLSQVGDAAIVVCATTSTEPVLDAGDVASGALVISVGSFAPHAAELTPALLDRAGLVVVDDIATAREQAGCLVRAGAAGVRPRLHALGELLNDPPGRDPERIVVYNSVGLGFQDAAAVAPILAAAAEQDAGLLIELG